MCWDVWLSKERSLDTRRPLKVNKAQEEDSEGQNWVTYFEKNFNLDTRRKNSLPNYRKPGIGTPIGRIARVRLRFEQ